MVLDRASANDPGMAAVVRAARFIYLAGGSPLHLKSVLKGSATFEALREAWTGGAVVAGSAAGAMVLTDPMVDPRGGALTVGLGLVDQLAVVPHFGDGPKTPTARSWSARWRWLPTGCPWWGSRSAPRSSGTATGRGATRARRLRWSSSTAPGPRGSAPCSAEQGPVVQSSSAMVTDSIMTFSVGLPERVPRASTVVTTSPPLHHGAEEGVLRAAGARRRVR